MEDHSGALVPWFENVEQLKQVIVLEWGALSQRFIDGRLPYRRMVDILNTNSTSCRHLYSVNLLFVAYIITDAGIYKIFFPSCLYTAFVLIVSINQ